MGDERLNGDGKRHDLLEVVNTQHKYIGVVLQNCTP